MNSEPDPIDDEYDDKCDPIDCDPKFKPILEAVMKEVMEELADHPRKGETGFCHIIWGRKKRILKEKYGLDWRTPREMNPMNFYD
jgi:hypothetical protein